jgi:single-stranded-DNA-specific exonuclease
MSKELKKWKIQKQPASSKEQIAGLPGWFLNILVNRGLDSLDAVNDYLEPEYSKLAPVENFIGMQEGVERIKQAISEKEKVVIYGDYDVDGITATALLSEVLNKISVHDFETYIPHRENEGYGLNQEALDSLRESGAKLIITVDCGISSKEIIDNQNELDFIVVDHHQIDDDKLSKKAINIHPSLTNDKKEYRLSGCGIAFYFARALQQEFKDVYLAGQEKWLLDLVALATICDIVPLVGDNRILATWGLKVLAKTKRKGLIQLAKIISINLSEVGSYEVGFLIGPRLNAAGRLEHAKLALELLTTDDSVRATEIAGDLNRLNIERQQMCERIIEEAREEIKSGSQKDHKIFLLSNKNWPRGVVGIVASRISDEHHRPVIVFEDDGEVHHGSARSIDGFNIVEALSSCDDCLESFGGHAKAAGLAVSKEKFILFSDKLVSIAKDKIKEEDLKKTVEIDTKIERHEINDEALSLIARMEPTGYGNTRPLFLLENVQIEGINRVGKGKEHLKFSIKQTANSKQQTAISGIAFSEERDLKEGKNYDLVGFLKYNIWNNRKSIEFRMVDFRERD